MLCFFSFKRKTNVQKFASFGLGFLQWSPGDWIFECQIQEWYDTLFISEFIHASIQMVSKSSWRFGQAFKVSIKILMYLWLGVILKTDDSKYWFLQILAFQNLHLFWYTQVNHELWCTIFFTEECIHH